jgi:predicted HTH domain antitoxin
MVINLPDDVFRAAGLSPADVVIELAAVLFDTGKLSFHAARCLTDLSRQDFEQKLRERHIAIHRPRLEDVRQELREIREERDSRASGHAA